MENFGEKLKKAMLVRGFTQNELSRQTGIHQGLISYYCADKVEPKPETIKKLANALDVELDYFMKESEIKDNIQQGIQEEIKEETKEEKEVKKVEKNITELKEKYYIDVTKDIKKSFAEEGITEDYLKFNIKDFVGTFMSLFGENNYIAEAKKAETIFNKTSIDYLHSIENTDWDFEAMQDAMYREKALLEIRRPTKDVIYYSKMVQPIIDYLKQDEEFMKLLELTKQYIDNQDGEEKFYIPKQSNLVKAEKEIYKKYACQVKCYNLYGNKTVKVLNKEGGIWAKNKEEAKDKFKNWIDRSFDTVTYKEKDIVVEEME